MQMSDSDLCPHCGRDVNYAGSPVHLPAGYVVSGKHPYVLGAALGQGGFGITYIALDMATSNRVAIKEYFPGYYAQRTDSFAITARPDCKDPFLTGKQLFLEESEKLQSLSDLESVVKVLDIFQANNTAYLVMEFLEGSSLKDYLWKNGIFPAQKFLEQITPLLEDVQKMHDREILHLDFEPYNIFIQPDGRMKIIDFGAARHYLQDRNTTMVFIPKFQSPELFRFHVPTAATDVYSLAGTIYYCITGTVPPDFGERIIDNIPLPVPSARGADTTAEQDQAFLNALELEQTKRTQSIRQFLEELHRKQTNSPRSLMSRMLGKLQKKQNITRS